MTSCSRAGGGFCRGFRPVLVLLAALGGGCAPLGLHGPDIMGAGPHVDGRWTGRLLSVPVYDGQKNRYDAAALQIEQGPRMPLSKDGQRHDVDAHGERERLALLVSPRDEFNVIDPSSLPVGQDVEVKGRMLLGRPLADHSGVTTSPVGGLGPGHLMIRVSKGPTPRPARAAPQRPGSRPASSDNFR